MYTLGINAAFHDSSACLVQDGRVLAAAEEERFTGIKHAKRPVPFSTYELPFHAIDYCLGSQDLHLIDVHHVAYSLDPAVFLKETPLNPVIELPLSPSAQPLPSNCESVWHPLFLSYIVNAPRQLADGAPHHLKRRFRGATPQGPFRWHFVQHHIAHAASAFYPSPYEEAAILTIDGRGEKATTTYGIGKNGNIELFGSVDMPNSLGLLYEKMTTYLGFLHSSDEYKVMALASFGKPVYQNDFRDIIQRDPHVGYIIREMDPGKLFGPARTPGGPFEARHYNLASSLQTVLEETVLTLADWLHRKTGIDSLCMAGGVALNCVMNASLRDKGPFKRIWVQPAAGDAGTALGAALYADMQQRMPGESNYRMEDVYLGPCWSDAEIESFLRSAKLSYHRMTNIAEEVSDLLVKNAVVGWFQGRMEFGPRALGARSILASPINASMQARLNEIKDREDFRPVAPAVLEEEADRWFVAAESSPFMLFTYKVREDKAGRIPAVCHIDGTARIQTVNPRQNQRYYELIKAFQKQTGVPLLVNTSFNTRGKPIVCSPRDAIECFYTSPLDALAIGSFLLRKPGI